MDVRHVKRRGLTYEILSSISGYSIQHLVEKFHAYLEQDPPDLPPIIQNPNKEAYLLIDGLWFGRWFVYFYNQDKLRSSEAERSKLSQKKTKED